MALKALAPILLLSLASDPGGPGLVEGALYWNSATNKLRVYADGVWNDATGSGGGGTQSAYVQASAPTVSAGTPYAWFQTDYGPTGTDWTLWIEDGH